MAAVDAKEERHDEPRGEQDGAAVPGGMTASTTRLPGAAAPCSSRPRSWVARDLTRLQDAFGDYGIICRHGEDGEEWAAWPRDGGEPLTAPSAPELEAKLRAAAP